MPAPGQKPGAGRPANPGRGNGNGGAQNNGATGNVILQPMGGEGSDVQPEGGAKWRGEGVKAETHRAIRELEQGLQKYKAEAERYNAAAHPHEDLVAKYCALLGTTVAGIIAAEDRIAEIGPQMAAYRNDLFWAQEYAKYNRSIMMALLKDVVRKEFKKAKPTFEPEISAQPRGPATTATPTTTTPTTTTTTPNQNAGMKELEGFASRYTPAMLDQIDAFERLRAGSAVGRLRAGSVKLMLDGILESRTAFMTSPVLRNGTCTILVPVAPGHGPEAQRAVDTGLRAGAGEVLRHERPARVVVEQPLGFEDLRQLGVPEVEACDVEHGERLVPEVQRARRRVVEVLPAGPAVGSPREPRIGTTQEVEPVLLLEPLEVAPQPDHRVDGLRDLAAGDVRR